MFTFILTAGPLQFLEVFAIKVFSSNAYITLAYSSIVHALYTEILSPWKIKGAIILSCNTIAYLRKFHRRAAQNLQVPARVCDVESGAVCSKNSTFGYLDGTAWTLRLRSHTSIMAPHNAPFIVIRHWPNSYQRRVIRLNGLSVRRIIRHYNSSLYYKFIIAKRAHRLKRAKRFT